MAQNFLKYDSPMRLFDLQAAEELGILSGTMYSYTDCNLYFKACERIFLTIRTQSYSPFLNLSKKSIVSERFAVNDNQNNVIT